MHSKLTTITKGGVEFIGRKTEIAVKKGNNSTSLVGLMKKKRNLVVKTKTEGRDKRKRLTN